MTHAAASECAYEASVCCTVLQMQPFQMLSRWLVSKQHPTNTRVVEQSGGE